MCQGNAINQKKPPPWNESWRSKVALVHRQLCQETCDGWGAANGFWRAVVVAGSFQTKTNLCHMSCVTRDLDGFQGVFVWVLRRRHLELPHFKGRFWQSNPKKVLSAVASDRQISREVFLWWLNQHTWKRLSQMTERIFPKFRDEHKKCLKPPAAIKWVT